MPVTLEIPVMEPLNALPLLVVFGFILFDWVSGLGKAFATNSYDSTKMREGLWHKAAIISVMVLAYALETATGVMDLSVIGWEPGSTLPVSSVVGGYIVLMEAGSVMENILAMNPDLRGKGFWRYFGKLTGGVTDGLDSAHESEGEGSDD